MSVLGFRVPLKGSLKGSIGFLKGFEGFRVSGSRVLGFRVLGFRASRVFGVGGMEI